MKLRKEPKDSKFKTTVVQLEPLSEANKLTEMTELNLQAISLTKKH